MDLFTSKMEDLDQETRINMTPLNMERPLLPSQQPHPLERLMSSPPLSPTSLPHFARIESPYQTPSKKVVSPLTPPTSPRHTKSFADLIDRATSNNTADPMSIEPSQQAASQAMKLGHPSSNDDATSVKLIECPFDVEILKDQSGHDRIFGDGAWSTVYSAMGRERRPPSSTSIFPTPSTSPTMSIPVLVALKKPSRRDAKAIIRNEGIVLSQISRTDLSEDFVIPFYGVDIATGSLVLGPVPLSLHNHIQDCNSRPDSRDPFEWGSMNPVIGTTAVWLSLARQVINALAWLHTKAGGAGVVHGDIKPGNILLSPNRFSDSPSDFAYTPLLADFSSSQLLSSTEITPNTLSAITREYTAPELLSSKVLNDPNSVATTASDVFSLAVTLLVAATGESLVYPGSMWQRQAMATQGWNVLSNVRNGDQVARLPRHGIVERVLERAVLKSGMGRINAPTWVQVVEQIGMGEPAKR